MDKLRTVQSELIQHNKKLVLLKKILSATPSLAERAQSIMATLMDNIMEKVSGKGRNGITNLWLAVHGQEARSEWTAGDAVRESKTCSANTMLLHYP